MSDRLFDIEDVPEVPLLREPRVRKGAARGAMSDARFANDYPPEWDRCTTCDGQGATFEQTDLRIDMMRDAGVPGRPISVKITHLPSGHAGAAVADRESPGMPRDAAVSAVALKSEALKMLLAHLRRDEVWRCPDCLGMGSLKARVRLEAGHRCVRCHHFWMPKGDAKMLGVERSGMQTEVLGDVVAVGGRGALTGVATRQVWTPWSPCDEQCTHDGQLVIRVGDTTVSVERGPVPFEIGGKMRADWDEVLAKWRILTVHHLDGDKANCRWWNLAALCQRCHLEIQAKVVMERVYPHEHSEWFKPYVAGYYAFVYLCKTCGIRVDWRHHTGPLAHPPSRPYILLDRLKHMAGEGGYPHRCEPGLEISRDEAMAHLVPLLELERAS